MTSISLLVTALHAAQAGADAIRAFIGGQYEVQSKGYRDYVTEADFASQKAILSIIGAAHPDHLILSEESPEANQLDQWKVPEGYWWIIDPLDGTTNFQLGMPTFCVSVAVAHGQQVQAGVIIDPNREMAFGAARGEGATLDGQPIHVSERATLIEAVASCDWPRPPAQRKRAFELASRYGNACRSFRSVGSAALSIAYVAAGWTDVYVHEHIKPWDCAAGTLIVAEAGGILTRHDGSAWTIMDHDLLATTPALHDEALRLLRDGLVR